MGAGRSSGWTTGRGLTARRDEAADGVNAAIYAARGDYINAALSAAAMIPIAGWAATGTKIAIKSADAVGIIRSMDSYG